MSEVNVQKTTGCNEIKINVKPVPANPVVIENSYRGIDYNVLKNKPKIEGNELIGDKTAKELLGFDKTDMDATIAVAQGAEEVANASNAKATQAYETATEAKQIAQAIDTKATQALTNSTTALETATQAKQTADSYQGQITTIRNDVDGLGDQVHEIEAKIPQASSVSNQLVDKASMTSAIAAVQKGVDNNAGDIAALSADLTDGLNQKADKAATYTKTEVDNAIKSLQMIKWVDTLPASGETKYLYAVAREEVDKDGHKIAALYLWDGTEWRGAGAFSLNIDPDTLATKTDLSGYLPLSGGILNGTLYLLRSYNNTYSLRNGYNVATIENVYLIIGNNSNKLLLDTVDERVRFRKKSTGKIQYELLSVLDKAVANGVASLDANTKVPSAQIPVATASSLGGVKPDGTTIIVKADGTASATGAGYTEGDGIKGDYCTAYGIIDAPNGILTNPSGMEVVLKQGVVLQLAGQDIKTTISGDMAHTITSTADCDLFYVSGTTSLMEVAQIVWSRIEPDNGQEGVLAWWNPDNKKWKFKSNDTGNVWAEAVATPVAHIHTNGTTITRIDHIGYRVLDDEVYALKSETNTALAGKANTDLSNVPANIDYVVEYKNPTDSDPNWYRKWKSGKLEQGGVVPATVGNITFPKPFANTNYTVIGNISLKYRRVGHGDGSGSVLFFPEATSFCYVTLAARNFGDIGNQNISWRAEGMGAN